MRSFPAILLSVAVGPPAVAAAQLTGDSAVYRLVAESHFDVHTGRAGLFGFLGHEHHVRADAFTGEVVYHPGDLSSSRVWVTVRADSLRVLTGADSSDLAAIRTAMRTQVLEVERFPTITFVSTAVEPVGEHLRVTGALTLVGRTDTVVTDITVEPVGSDTLRVQGQFAVRQTQFGIRPYRTALGTVQVADRIVFQFDALAVRRRDGLP